MKLTEYLAARGNSKALTKIEAEAFGVPYPLMAGWPRRYGATEITPGMIEQLRAKAIGNSATSARALRGLAAGTGVAGPVVRVKAVRPAVVIAPMPHRVAVTAFPGFRLRSQCAAGASAGRLPWE